MNTNTEIEGWWPAQLKPLQTEDPMATDDVVVAEVSQLGGRVEYYSSITALVDPDSAEELLTNPGMIDHKVTTNGPHPSLGEGIGDFKPKFWIWAGDIAPEGLEPLVVEWRTGQWTTILPDQGFLMTYGLAPRFQEDDKNETVVIWDNPSIPHRDVVVAKSLSTYDYPHLKDARITIKHDYLIDYATVRGKSLIQSYYVLLRCPMSEELGRLFYQIGDETFKLKGRSLRVSISSNRIPPVFIEISGAKLLANPGDAPISRDSYRDADFKWPGVKKPENWPREKPRPFSYAYVKDTVLGIYEGVPDYEIIPEKGIVSYKGQWSTGNNYRVCRDIIAVELKSIHDSAPREVIETWQNFAINPPKGNIRELAMHPNVAWRAITIVDRLLALGESLAWLYNMLFHENKSCRDLIGLDRASLEYHGWWKPELIAPITYHIPMEMTKMSFLSRCGKLDKLIAQSLNEAFIRAIVERLPVEPKDIKELGSLSLLKILSQHTIIANSSGLVIVNDGEEIESRRKPQDISTPVADLLYLNKLRIDDAHIGHNYENCLKGLGFKGSSVGAGHGIIMDKLYDRLGIALFEIVKSLNTALDSLKRVM